MKEMKSIGKADILIGIPSYNNARTIGHVVAAALAGCAKYFQNRKAVLVNSDGGSTDGTEAVVKSAGIDDLTSILVHHPVSPTLAITTPYHGIPGKGSAFKTIFQIADVLNVQACAVVDSDLRSITPEWIELLVKPVLEGGFHYVAPFYHRHKYDGTITNSIIYPLTRALYGKRVRQPIGGDFGFAGDLARFYLTKDVWGTDVARYGIDVWMTTTALANGFRVCQAFLGAKIHDPKDPGADLSAMLYQVVGATFELMEEYCSVWRAVRGSDAVPTFGFQYAVGLEPVTVKLDRMVEKFRLGVRELTSVWERVLSHQVLQSLRTLERMPVEDFHLPEEVWVEIIYSFGLAVHRHTIHTEHLLRSLLPLYMGRTASFVRETRESDVFDVEHKIERLCELFEEWKPFLVNNWD